MSDATRPITDWPDALKKIIALRCTSLRRVFVVKETASTQDAARTMKAQAGDVVAAWRQTGGRGRLGRAWADTGTNGIAVTFVTHSTASTRLAIASAVAAARTAEHFLNPIVGLKWPNDVMVQGRKLAGILIEQSDDFCFTGIGMNVRQQTFSAELADRAVSLAQLGAEVDRLKVVEQLLVEFDEAAQLDDNSLIHEFTQRDIMMGNSHSFQLNGEVHRGKVTRVDPMNGLCVETETGEVWLPAATTTVLDE